MLKVTDVVERIKVMSAAVKEIMPRYAVAPRDE